VCAVALAAMAAVDTMDARDSELLPPPAPVSPLDELVNEAINAVSTFYLPGPVPVDEKLMRTKLMENRNMKNIASLQPDLEERSLEWLKADLTSLLKLERECVEYVARQVAARADALRANQRQPSRKSALDARDSELLPPPAPVQQLKAQEKSTKHLVLQRVGDQPWMTDQIRAALNETDEVFFHQMHKGSRTSNGVQTDWAAFVQKELTDAGVKSTTVEKIVLFLATAAADIRDDEEAARREQLQAPDESILRIRLNLFFYRTVLGARKSLYEIMHNRCYNVATGTHPITVSLVNADLADKLYKNHHHEDPPERGNSYSVEERDEQCLDGFGGLEVPAPADEAAAGPDEGEYMTLNSSYVLSLDVLVLAGGKVELLQKLVGQIRELPCWFVEGTNDGQWTSTDGVSVQETPYVGESMHNVFFRPVSKYQYNEDANRFSHHQPFPPMFPSTAVSSNASSALESIHPANEHLEGRRIIHPNSPVRGQAAHLISKADLDDTGRGYLDHEHGPNFMDLPNDVHCAFDGRQIDQRVCKRASHHEGRHPAMIAFRLAGTLGMHDGQQHFRLRIYGQTEEAAMRVQMSLHPKVSAMGIQTEYNLHYFDYLLPIIVSTAPFEHNGKDPGYDEQFEPAVSDVQTPKPEYDEGMSKILYPNHHRYVCEGDMPTGMKQRRVHQVFQDCVFESYLMRVGSWRKDSRAGAKLRQLKLRYECDSNTLPSFTVNGERKRKALGKAIASAAEGGDAQSRRKVPKKRTKGKG